MAESDSSGYLILIQTKMHGKNEEIKEKEKKG